VGALKRPATGRLEYADVTVPGLWIRVSPSKIVYVVRYRVGGRDRRQTLGEYPAVRLRPARKRAKDILEAVAFTKKDPRDVEAASRPGLNLQDLVGAYIDASEPNLAPTTATEYRRMAKKNLAAEAFAGPAAELGRGDLREALEAIAKKSGPIMANRLFQLLRAACRWGVREERRGPGGPKSLLARNPCEGLQRPRKREKPRARVLTDREVAALWVGTDPGRAHADVDEAKCPCGAPTKKPKIGERRFCPRVAAACARIELLLGQRPTESVSMEWADIDSDRAEWSIQERKGDIPNLVPLPPLATTILDGIKPITGSRRRAFHGVSMANPERDWWDDIRARAVAVGKGQGWDVQHFTRHDLRRTCSTRMGDLGVPDEVISLVLGHVKRDLTGRVYNLSHRMGERRAALIKWSERVEELAKMVKRT
jgi:integrase